MLLAKCAFSFGAVFCMNLCKNAIVSFLSAGTESRYSCTLFAFTALNIFIRVEALFFLCSFAQNAAHRRAYGLIFSMDTTNPTTRTAHTFFKFAHGSPYMVFASFFFLYKRNPANPFIARKWREALPQFKSCLVRCESFFKILWQSMHRAAGNLLCSHGYF